MPPIDAGGMAGPGGGAPGGAVGMPSFLHLGRAAGHSTSGRAQRSSKGKVGHKKGARRHSTRKRIA